MAQCEIRAEHDQPGGTVVVVSGDCGPTPAARLQRVLTKATERGDRVVVDLSQTQTMDATSLHVLLDAQRDAADQGIDMVAVLREDVALLAETSLDLAAVPNAMPTFPSREAALAARP
jgi:anti-anti-sigma factor